MMPFYKYQPINRYTLQNLVKQKNWVADPLSFNDPFEFRVIEPHFLGEEGRLKYLNDEELKNRQFIIDNINLYGVISYSAEDSNQLLWAHYADNHRGMCLVFDVPKPIDMGMYKVNYTNVYPDIDFLSGREKIQEEITKIVTSKSKEWSYEEEYRQVFFDKSFHHDYPGKLVEIIFGCRSTTDDMELIFTIINDKCKDIQVSKMFIHKNTYNLMKSSIPLGNDISRIPEYWKDTVEM